MDSEIISTTSIAQFTAEKGSEFVICNITGKPYATQKGVARILEMPESTLRGKLGTRGLNDEGNGFQTISPIDGVVEHSGGNGSARAKLFSAKDVLRLALDYNPKVADLMAEGGASMYLLHLAGYKAKLVEPESTQPQFDIPKTLGEALLLAGELSNKLDIAQAKIEADSEATALGEYLNKGEGLIGIGEMARVLEIGRNRFFIELRELGIMLEGKTIPKQIFLDRGYFKVTETLTNDRNIVMVTLVTPKGQLYLAKRHKQFLANEWMIARVEREVNLI